MFNTIHQTAINLSFNRQVSLVASLIRSVGILPWQMMLLLYTCWSAQCVGL